MMIRAKQLLAAAQDDAFLVNDFIQGTNAVSSTDAVIAEIEANLRTAARQPAADGTLGE